MFKSVKACLLLGCCFQTLAMAATPLPPGPVPDLSQQQLRWLQDRIYQNECNARASCLTAWNEGEDFPSLGIGHFIWLRAGQTVPFTETFPALLVYLQTQGVKLPAWLSPRLGQPWPDRTAFLADQQGRNMTELRSMLEHTRVQQTAFIVQRFARLLQDPASPFAADPVLSAKLRSVASAQIPYGLYALIDYLHFKGEGTSLTEQYQGEGWGLKQVLERMPANSNNALEDYVASAGAVLERRVRSAPAARHEARWLAGWLHRLQTYLPNQ